MRRPFLTIALFLTAAFSLQAAPSAQDMRDAQNSIIQRLPEIENLWNRGLTGENNEGFVAARSSLNSTQIALIQQENRDRIVLYNFVADKTGSDLFQVSRERAAQVAKMAKKGLWIQKTNGDWVRK
tara:strand:+ start:281 stop:658 length:378 start_codon:yes stop_codon:yes gene_type:complete